ncbi:MAG TPA: MFS transporter, partial [Streptosporangiaceae bacterium]
MTTTAGRDLASSLAGRARSGWITEWDPEDVTFWAARGSRVARRNLVCSIFTEHVGFAVWSLWSVFALFLTPAYGHP